MKNIKEIYKLLTPEQRSEFGVASIVREGFWEKRGCCQNCDGPTKVESGWGIDCVNECWKLEHFRLNAQQTLRLNTYIAQTMKK